MNRIPENYTDFLYWVKETTEAFWSKDPEDASVDFKCEPWLYGAKWIGLDETKIGAIEEKYSIKFMPEHREFLKIMHTIDRKEEIAYTETFEEDAVVLTEKRPFFYNWLEDEVAIRERLVWPYQTMLDDVLGQSQVWLQSWGPKGRPDEDKHRIFSDWFDKIPQLIPVTGHRFLVSDPELSDRPVLSVWGSDTIVYGWNFRHYLLNELAEHLDLFELVYDTEDQCYYTEEIKELQDIKKYEFASSAQKDIPFLKEMILFWSSGWSSFGLEFPRESSSGVHSIIKTYVPDDEVNDQKRFNSF